MILPLLHSHFFFLLWFQPWLPFRDIQGIPFSLPPKLPYHFSSSAPLRLNKIVQWLLWYGFRSCRWNHLQWWLRNWRRLKPTANLPGFLGFWMFHGQSIVYGLCIDLIWGNIGILRIQIPTNHWWPIPSKGKQLMCWPWHGNGSYL